MDLVKLNTSNVTDMSSMFAYSWIDTSSDIGSWDTSNVINTSYMFCEKKGNWQPNCVNGDVSSVKTYNCFSSGPGGVPYFDFPSLLDISIAHCMSGTNPA